MKKHLWRWKENNSSLYLFLQFATMAHQQTTRSRRAIDNVSKHTSLSDHFKQLSAHVLHSTCRIRFCFGCNQKSQLGICCCCCFQHFDGGVGVGLIGYGQVMDELIAPHTTCSRECVMVQDCQSWQRIEFFFCHSCLWWCWHTQKVDFFFGGNTMPVS